MSDTDRYELWISQGQGSMLAQTVIGLGTALQAVEARKHEGNWGIKYPNGEWHKWHPTPQVTPTMQLEWRVEPQEDVWRVTFLLMDLEEFQAVQNLAERIGRDNNYRHGYRVTCTGSCSKGPQCSHWDATYEFDELPFFNSFVTEGRAVFGEPLVSE